MIVYNRDELLDFIKENDIVINEIMAVEREGIIVVDFNVWLDSFKFSSSTEFYSPWDTDDMINALDEDGYIKEEVYTNLGLPIVCGGRNVPLEE